MPEDEHYNSEIERLIPAVDAKGPGELTRALFAEVDAARELLLADSEPPPETDLVLNAIRSRLAGTFPNPDCTRYGDVLMRDMTTMPPLNTNRGQARTSYKSACAYLPAAEADADSAYFVCLSLIDFVSRWMKCSRAAAQYEQLSHLRAALDGRPRDSLPESGERGRVSLLAR
jgi:hypothetical protein